MKLLVNGEQLTIPTNVKTISDLIQHFSIQNPVVIVEHNQKILNEEEHATTEISDGDKIELVQFVGGG